MRWYLLSVALVGVVFVAMLTPGVALVVSYATFGAGFLAVQGLVNLFAVLVILIPAAWLEGRSAAAGGLLGIALLCAAIFGPGLARDGALQTHPLMQPPLLAELEQPPKSIELWSKPGCDFRTEAPSSDLCRQLMNNPDLDWIRFRVRSNRNPTRLYVRDSTGLLTLERDHHLTADLVVDDYDEIRQPPAPRVLDLWEVSEGPRGYIVTDTRSGRVILRNTAATLSGVSDHAVLVLDVEMTGAVSLSLRRTVGASVSADPGRTLESDLAALGLVDPGKSFPGLNDPEILDLAVQRVIDRVLTTPHVYPSAAERRVMREFDSQLAMGLRLAERRALVFEVFKTSFDAGAGIHRALAADPSLRQDLFAYTASLFGTHPTFDNKVRRLGYWYGLERGDTMAELGRYETELAAAFAERRAVYQERALDDLDDLKMAHPELILDQVPGLPAAQRHQ